MMCYGDGMDYMTVGQAAEALGVSPRAIRHRIAVGEMQAEQINPRLWMIPRAEVERWTALGRMRPGPKPKREGKR